MSKSIEEQVECWKSQRKQQGLSLQSNEIDTFRLSLQERDRIAYERGHAHALSTIPIYVTDNLTPPTV